MEIDLLTGLPCQAWAVNAWPPVGSREDEEHTRFWRLPEVKVLLL